MCYRGRSPREIERPGGGVYVIPCSASRSALRRRRACRAAGSPPTATSPCSGPRPDRAGRFFLISAVRDAGHEQLMNDFLKDERGFSACRARCSMADDMDGIRAGGRRMADVLERVDRGGGVAGGAHAHPVASFMSTAGPMWVWNLFGTILAAAAGPALGCTACAFVPHGAQAADGIIQTVSVAGSALGLVFAGHLVDQQVALASAMRPLLIGPLVVAVLVLLFFPETARRRLGGAEPGGPGPGVARQPRSCEGPAEIADRRLRQRAGRFGLVRRAGTFDPDVGDRSGDGGRRPPSISSGDPNGSLSAADEQAARRSSGRSGRSGACQAGPGGCSGWLTRTRAAAGGLRPRPWSTSGRPSSGRPVPAGLAVQVRPLDQRRRFLAAASNRHRAGRVPSGPPGGGKVDPSAGQRTHGHLDGRRGSRMVTTARARGEQEGAGSTHSQRCSRMRHASLSSAMRWAAESWSAPWSGWASRSTSRTPAARPRTAVPSALRHRGPR